MSDIRILPEWAPRRALWTAWPSAADLWEGDLEPARDEVAAMVKALAPGERVRVLASGPEAVASAVGRVGTAKVIEAKFGDIWLRDTGPIFARDKRKAVALGFQFNGWGGKYQLDGDANLAERVAAEARVEFRPNPFVLEGGAIEMDGEGTLLTTRQCLLNPNRNADWDEAKAEAALKEALGVEKVLWLDEGLANDHTDGHIDNLARFVAPGVIVCQAPYKKDPNAAVLDRIFEALTQMTDAKGRRLRVHRIPSPGLVLGEDDEAIPASHMNFIIGVKTVVVPIYSDSADEAVRALAPLFPGRKVVGLSSNAILTGGGSFHCITQQEPS
ncbi:MAG: agmatine deiminase [Alphaproteobacteria bacterium]|nr:MAG: agmatine deiminase [Caulobacteraceae bacterium]TPW07168.1 MAG: agmatine deiminase [Alphaproteobacteria bacterium]